MNDIYVGDQVYHHRRNKDNSYSIVQLIDPDSSLIDKNPREVLVFSSDYRVYEQPDMVRIGQIFYEGDYLVFIPVEGKVYRPHVLRINPDNIIAFHREVARWWLLRKQNGT